RRIRTDPPEHLRHTLLLAAVSRGVGGDELLDGVRVHAGLPEAEVDLVAGLIEKKTNGVSDVGGEGGLPDLDGNDEARAVDLDAIRRLAVDQIDATAIGGDVLELLFDRLQARVVLIAEGVIRRPLHDVAAAPELDDVDLALRVSLEHQERVELG